MRKLSNRFFPALGFLTFIATIFLTARVSAEIDFASPADHSSTTFVSGYQTAAAINSQESGQAKKDQKSEGAIEVYEGQDSDDKSSIKRLSQFGQAFTLISFGLALIFFSRRGRHQLLWLTHSPDSLPKSYLLFRVIRI